MLIKFLLQDKVIQIPIPSKHTLHNGHQRIKEQFTSNSYSVVFIIFIK